MKRFIIDSKTRTTTAMKLFPDSGPRISLKKLTILEAYIKAVATHGFDAVTYELLADLAKTAKSRVYYHYKSLAKINLDGLSYINLLGQEITSQYVMAAEHWQEKFLSIAEAGVELVHLYPESMAIFNLSYYQAFYDKDYQKAHMEMKKTGRDRAFEIISPNVRVSEKEIDKMIHQLQVLYFGYFLDLGSRPPPYDLNALGKNLKSDFNHSLGRLVSGGYK